jgi:hypothetical protein
MAAGLLGFGFGRLVKGGRVKGLFFDHRLKV